MHRLALFCLTPALLAATTIAQPPQLYRQAAFESPVRADPDDLLLLPGYGLSADDLVIYRSVADSSRTPPPPTGVPTQSSAESGLADVVSSAEVPYALTIKVPAAWRADQTYALWVRTARNVWSKPVMVNDARPLWLSPAYAYATGSIAGLPRELKIVGRNLQAAPGSATTVRLTGPESYALKAVSDLRSTSTMDHYVTRIALPSRLAPGSYHVALSRDQRSWIELPDQQLEVLPDPVGNPMFNIADRKYGACMPDDGVDDTSCIVSAIAAASSAGGGTVYFPAGTWDLVRAVHSGLAPSSGILVPAGIALQGAGSGRTRLLRHPEWNEQGETAAFTLSSRTQVTGFTFRDLKTYVPEDRAEPILRLGEDYRRVPATSHPDDAASTVSGVVIAYNVFDRVFVAIAGGGLPMRRLFITHNTFGAYYAAIEMGGDQFNMTYKYRIDDSVIDDNLFEPGSRLDRAAKTGTMASELGAGFRLDFSGNTADGTATQFLYAPEDPHGWRAAFFWNMNGSFEQMLVSQNEASCTGDKIGDGEAISYDNNTNTFGFAAAPTVTHAEDASVTVTARLAARQNNRDIPVASYYLGHWLQVVSGPGLGQVRRIVGYTTDASTGLTSIRVAPAWDVVPVAGITRIAVGREFWQVYTLDNRVEQRRPPCQKSNRSRHDGGVIAMYAQSADSVIEGNVQRDTDGILVAENYILPEHACPDCAMSSFLQDFLEIRGNTIDGEYDWDTDCSDSGIVTSIAASPAGDPIPPTLGFGISISHNTVRRADAAFGGAIAQTNPWYAGPAPHNWPLSENQLIHHNVLEDIDGPRALAICGNSLPRIGINFPPTPIAWHSVLYANRCTRVSQPIGGDGKDTVRVCPSPVPDSCECPRP